MAKSTISVASVVYNLAGDEEKRPDYLKTLVIGNSIANTGASMSDTINQGYLAGPGIKLRNFARWAATSGYNDIMGFSYAELSFGDSINQDTLALHVPLDGDDIAILQSAEIGRNNISYFGEVFVYANYPALWDSAWVADLLDNGDIKIIFADASETTFTPSPAYDPLARYLHVRYVTAKENIPGTLIEGDPVVLGSSDPFPDMTDWTEVHPDTEVPTDVDTLQTVDVLVTYSDGRPDETSHTETPGTMSYDHIAGEWTKMVYTGGTAPFNTHFTQYHEQNAVASDLAPVVDTVTEDIGGGVTKTTKTTTVDQELVITRQYRENSQDFTVSERSTIKAWNYLYESGDAVLDAMFVPPVTKGQFFPYIPFRLENLPVDNTNIPILYPWAKKAFKKAIGGRFDKTLDDIADNDDIEDVDFAYATFGVSLNVKEASCKKYIYKFFQYMLDNTFDSGDYEAWKVQVAAYKAATDAYNAWALVQKDGPEDDPLFGTEAPTVPPVPVMPTQVIQVASGGSPITNFNQAIYWSALAESVGVGQKIPGAKKGDLWWDGLSTEEFPNVVFNGSYIDLDPQQVAKVVLNWQETDNSWRSLAFYNLTFKNYIYKGKSVDITALEALLDTDESGFIVPLHVELYRSLSIVDSTQMSTACCIMQFNCYTEVKQKWYETSWFKVLIVIVIAVVSVFTGGAGAGLLGANVAIGTSLGFTGTIALIVGAVANAVAAMILTNIITSVSTQLFGDKIGGIIGAIASMVAINVGTSIANGGTTTTGFAELMKPDNLLKLTEPIGKGLVEYVNQGTKDIAALAQEAQKSADQQLAQISTAYADNIGTDRAALNPLFSLDITAPETVPLESPDSFLSRTLLTGSEVVDMSQSLLTNFTSISLNTETPI